MIAKINIDGEDRWVIVMPAKTSSISLDDLLQVSHFIYLGIASGEYRSVCSIPTLLAACDLASVMTEMQLNTPYKERIAKKAIAPSIPTLDAANIESLTK